MNEPLRWHALDSRALKDNLVIEEVRIAEEMQSVNDEQRALVHELFAAEGCIEDVPHETIESALGDAKLVVQTGETTPYGTSCSWAASASSNSGWRTDSAALELLPEVRSRRRSAHVVSSRRSPRRKERRVTYVLSTAWVLPGKSERLRSWYAEIAERREEVLQTHDNEGVRQEVAFILNTEHGELLAVFIEVDDMDQANEAFFDSPFEIDRQHREVMDECTVGGSTGRVTAELMYAFQNPKKS